MNYKKGLVTMLCCFVFLMPLLQPSPSFSADTVIKVFKIHYRFAEDLEKTVELFLSSEGRVVADKHSNSLVVKDYPENIKAVAEFLKEHDTIQQQVLINIQYIDETAIKEAGIQVNWLYRDRHWAVGNAVGSGTGLNINAMLAARKQKLSLKGEQTLLVMSGRTGRIETGISIPYTDWFYQYARRNGYLTREIKFRDVTTGFIVHPRIVGDTIHINISPRISYLGEGGDQEIIFRNAGTQIICKDGETVLIGSSVSSDENLVWNILGRAFSQKRKDNFFIALTPGISRQN